MGGIGKGMLIVLVILYVLSPIDAAVGLIDDFIIGLIGFAAVSKKK